MYNETHFCKKNNKPKLRRLQRRRLQLSTGNPWGRVADCNSVTRHSTSTRWHFAFGLCCHSNETRAPIANPTNIAQPAGTPYHSPKLHQGPCSSVGMRRGTDIHTDTQTDARDHYAFRVAYDSREM